DTENQEFMTVELPGSVVTAGAGGPVDGRLTGDLTFIVEIGNSKFEVTVPVSATNGLITAETAINASMLAALANSSLAFAISFGPGQQTVLRADFTSAPANAADLVRVLNEAIRASTLSGKVVFSIGGDNKLKLGPATVLA